MRRFDALPEDVRKSVREGASVREMHAALAAFEAAQPLRPPAPGAALMSPSPLGPRTKTAYTNADLMGMTFRERQAIYRDGRRGRVRIVGDPNPFSSSR
jgi:hypothetical protein